MNEVYLKPKKNNKEKIIIFLMSLIIIGLASFITYEKTIKKETIKKEEPKEVKEDLNLVANYLVDKIKNYNVDYFDKEEVVDFTKLEKQDLLLSAYYYSMPEILNKKTVDYYLKNLFNIQLEEYPNIECFAKDGPLYEFDKEKNEYKESCGNYEGVCHGHGGVDVSKSLIIKHSDIKKEKDNYIVTVTKVYGLDEKNSDGYFYSDNEYKTQIHELDSFINNVRNNNSINIRLVNIKSVENYYNINYDELKKYGPKYEYTFKKIDNDYYLTNYKKIK